MSETFDPYHAWLGIPAEEQPPNYYRLLDLRRFEDDPDAIAAAADRRVGGLHAYRAGSLAGVARRLLDEVADAKACLLNPARKAAYDEGLRQSLQAETEAARQSEEAERARTERFLAILGERDLLAAELIEGLRKQATESQKPVPTEAVAKRLIEAGHLTPALAKRLLAAGLEGVSEPAEPPPERPGDEPGPPAAEADDELQLAPLDDELRRGLKPAAPKAPPQETAKTPTQDDDLQLAPLDDRPRIRPRPATPKPPPRETPETPAPETGPKPPPPPPAGVAPDSLLEEELTSLRSGGAEAAAGGPLVLTPKRTGWRRLFFPRRRPGRKANVWDSPLLLIGGGILLTLLLMLIPLVRAVSRQSGNEALRLANQDYRDGSYRQAITKYNQYLEKYSNHPGVDLALVNRGLAQLRQVTPKGTKDWSPAFQMAKEVLEKIGGKKELKQAQGDVSAILLTIAQGLAAQARQEPTPKLVEEARETMALMKDYVSTLPGREISEIEASLALTDRDIARGDRLAQAISEMKQAVAQGDTQRAYSVRKSLLRDYPLLADNGQLGEALIEVSQAQQKAVQLVEKPRPPETGERATALRATVALARRTATAGVPGAKGHVVFATAGGASYGLDAATGKVLWRRFVGFDSAGQGPGFAPTPISTQPDSDVLLVDSARNELLRVEAVSGRPIWRHAIGEPFDAHPVVAGGQILVAARSGRLVRIDAAKGSSADYVKFPQELRVAPLVDPRRSWIFQVADHSNLFVLALADGRCKQVVHLGHDLGSITAPPAIVGRFLLIAVNDRARDSVLRVFQIDQLEKGLSLSSVQQVRLSGHVDVAPSVDGRRGRVLVATDLGAVHLFEISATDKKRPLREAAKAAPGDDGRMVRFALMQADHVWISGAKLTKYYIDLSRRRLVPKWTGRQSGAGQQPLAAIGDTIFDVRRRLGTPGVLVSAVEMGEGREPWKTHLAAPLATEPIVDPAAAKITAVTSTGGVYRLDAAGLEGQRVKDQPDAAPQPAQFSQTVGHVVRLDDGLLAMTSGEGSDRVAVFDPGRQPEQLGWLELPDTTLACPPIAFAGGLLAPCKVGQVFLLDPRSGSHRAGPFQPWLEGGIQLPWRLPAAFGEDEFVLADGASKIYRVGIKDQPKPHLVARGQQELSQPIVSPVAVTGEVAYAVDAAGVLAVFELPELTRAKHQEQSLSGRCVWGPRLVGRHVMLATDDEKLLCLAGSGELRWRAELPYSPLAGTPLDSGDHYVLAAVGGVVWRVDAETGEELGKIETGRPLGTGPVLLGKQLLLGGRDGSLYIVEQP
ncbi:MAG: outer membrane protein assembly factor BamB family protein [Planctomycetota bacterium]|jgi:outer membrane protein assembly factor BamB